MGKKLTFDFLTERGYVPVTVLNAVTIIHSKWGFELEIHGEFVYCNARIHGGKNIRYEHELIEIENELQIDKTPIITKMSVDELKALLPAGYTYILNKRKKFVNADSAMSYSIRKGRYKIIKGDELISEGYNDEEESYFLMRSLLFILKIENKLPKNGL
jgi:hypothetical protein